MTAAREARRKLVATTLGLGIGGAVYFVTLLGYQLNLGRTALAGGYFSGVFDVQGRMFLDGRLDMPPESLGIEAFVHDGKSYAYFPPLPALLRLPILMTTNAFDGRLTALSMAVAWVVLATMCTRLIWLLLPLLIKDFELTRGAMFLVVCFLAAATGGTVLTFDASLPWMYHEVYLWAATSAIGACYWLIRVALEPNLSNIRWLGVFTLMCVFSRTTEGWAVCLTIVVLAAWMRWRPRTSEHRRWWWAGLSAGLVPLLLGIAINVAKFDSLFMFPLDAQVWSTLSPRRQEALAANGGSLTGLQFFPTSFVTYLRPDGIRFVDYFPWITLPANPPRAYAGAFYDQAYRTGSITAFMPLFVACQFLTVLAVARPRVRFQLRILRFPLAAGILATAGVMAYGYYANRYTSDFMPALVVSGAIGIALLAGYLQQWPAALAPLSVLVGCAAAFSLAAQLAIGYYQLTTTYRGEPLKQYIARQLDLSPSGQAGLVTATSGLPTGGRTDQLAIRGDCEALYLNTGDFYDPWITVEQQEQVISLDARRLRPGTARLLSVSGKPGQWVEVQVNSFRQVRVNVSAAGELSQGRWSDFPTTGGFRLGIRLRADLGYYEFSSVPGGLAGLLPAASFDEQMLSQPAVISMTLGAVAQLGLHATIEDPLPLALCQRVAENAQLELPKN